MSERDVMESCPCCDVHIGAPGANTETLCWCGAALVWDDETGWEMMMDDEPVAENLPGNWGAYGGDE